MISARVTASFLVVLAAATVISTAVAQGQQTSREKAIRCWPESGFNPCRRPVLAIDVVSSDDAWAVGEDGIIRRWDGRQWLDIASPLATDLNPAALRSVSMASPTLGWAVGGGETLRWDGLSWKRVTELSGAWMVALNGATDGWAIADNVIYRWNGTRWDVSGAVPDRVLQAVTGVSENDAWAVGGGVVARWDGTAWQEMEPDQHENQSLTGVSAVSANDVWAVGGEGLILHWDGQSWTKVASPTRDPLSDVEMLSATDGWIVGGVGGDIFRTTNVLLHWDGTSWTPVVSPFSTKISDIDMATAGDGWIASPYGGYIARWDGTNWSLGDEPMSSSIEAISMVNTHDGWSVGGKEIHHWNGTTWQAVASPRDAYWMDVEMLSATDGWIVGGDGRTGADALRWNGEHWQEAPKPATEVLGAISMTDDKDGWAVSLFSRGNAYHWDGTLWTAVPFPNSQMSARDIIAVSSANVWAVGYSGLILHWDGSNWTAESSPTDKSLNSVAMRTADDGWAVGAGGTIVRWDGKTWRLVQTAPTATMYDINFSSVRIESDRSAWIVGDKLNTSYFESVILHWDGKAWTRIASPTQKNLNTIDVRVPRNGWIGGDQGVLLRLEPYTVFLPNVGF